ncbi:MAG: hypothetical protein A2Y41_01735 [Spirochaetes bacterium GWB1_36_13]|nr:MAG: hypothetical protein A2Y41_01735 [Spirochaetes bacterium GWB1_36_13]
MKTNLNKDTLILLFSIIVIACCGLLYELLIGTASSYLLGNSVEQFSLTIGAFMVSFGIGSYLTRFVQKNIIVLFFVIETLIGFFGSISIISLFYFYSVSDVYSFLVYFFIAVIGVMVGFEIPLIGRIINDIKNNFKLTLSNLFSFDYIGAMIGSVALPLFLLPYFGLIKSSILVGIGNLVVALLFGIRFRKSFSQKLLLLPIVLIFFNLFLLVGARDIQIYLEQRLYEDKIVYFEQTKYQRIVITENKEDVRLFLDGNIQFSSKDEARYHELLIHIPLALAEKKEKLKILILGGGDGLAVREMLKYSNIEKITICDLDQRMTELFRDDPKLTLLNEHSLSSPLVEVFNEDAFNFLKNSKRQWDIIIADLPDPNNESLAKLYSTSFYHYMKKNLEEKGVGVTQSTSPYHAREAFWCIFDTLKKAGFASVLPYQAEVPSFGSWGFILFSDKVLAVPQKIEIADEKLKFLSDELITSLFIFPKDTAYVKTKPNTLFEPSILTYYLESWKYY